MIPPRLASGLLVVAVLLGMLLGGLAPAQALAAPARMLLGSEDL